MSSSVWHHSWCPGPQQPQWCVGWAGLHHLPRPPRLHLPVGAGSRLAEVNTVCPSAMWTGTAPVGSKLHVFLNFTLGHECCLIIHCMILHFLSLLYRYFLNGSLRTEQQSTVFTFFFSSTDMALASFRKMALPHRSSRREVNWWYFHLRNAQVAREYSRSDQLHSASNKGFTETLTQSISQASPTLSLWGPMSEQPSRANSTWVPELQSKVQYTKMRWTISVPGYHYHSITVTYSLFFRSWYWVSTAHTGKFNCNLSKFTTWGLGSIITQ